MSEMEMFVYKWYRDKTYKTLHIGYGHIRYMGKVDGESYKDCVKKARKVLGRSNRGKIYLAWKWNNSEYGWIAEYPNGLDTLNDPYGGWNNAMDLKMVDYISGHSLERMER